VAFILSRSVEHPNNNSSTSAVASPHGIHRIDTTCIDTSSIFGLIDRVLPFEACLYHEILPLYLDDRTLKLGMVTLTDVAALDYARKILSFLNYSLVPQAIDSEMQHRILSQYLQFKGQVSTVEEEPTVFYEAEEISKLRAEVEKVGKQDLAGTAARTAASLAVAPPIVSPTPRSTLRPIDRETLIVEAPEALDTWTFGEEVSIGSPQHHHQDNHQHHAPVQRSSRMDATVIQNLGEEDLPERGQSNLSQANLSQANLSQANSKPSSVPVPKVSLPTPGDALPTLSIKTAYLTVSPEELKALDSTELLENLLGQVLESGIGRLYFEHQMSSGRVLSSNSGVLQSMVENLPIDRFESLIWALKNLMKVHPEPVTEPIQVEIERWHEKNRLLLRLRVMPKWADHEVIGEDATLQILRGAALRFYQQQQSTNLRRDTLLVAKNLQLKIQALQKRSKNLNSQEDSSNSKFKIPGD
jgi:Type II secretion system (T2SS), protein E, N-terminal domain